MLRTPAILLFGIITLVTACEKDDSTLHFDGNYMMTVDLIHFPHSVIYIDGDTNSNYLSLTVNGNRNQLWKLASVGKDNFSILASDIPGFGLHVSANGSPEVAKLPASSNQTFSFHLAPADNNTFTIQSVAFGKYLSSSNCDKMFSGIWSTWSGNINFAPDITHCASIDPSADTCYCTFSFHFVKQ